MAKCNAGTPVTAEYTVTTILIHTSLDAGSQANSFGPGTETLWGPIPVYEANGSGAVIASDGSFILNPNYFLAGGENLQNPGHCEFGGIFYVS
jgi:hypothetical protein